MPDNIDAKSGRLVVDVLREKHPALIVPNVKVLEYYGVVPGFVPIDITEDMIK